MLGGCRRPDPDRAAGLASAISKRIFNGSAGVRQATGEPPVSATAGPQKCPYVGLDPFESAYAEYFFGRRQVSKVIADHVLARPVTVLYGPSGIGKSSILNVGLPAALEQIAVAAREE